MRQALEEAGFNTRVRNMLRGIMLRFGCPVRVVKTKRQAAPLHLKLQIPRKSDQKFLYRALRPDEIERGVLIPKKPGEPFVDSLRFPQVFPLRFGESPEHAVRSQQWDSDQYPTSGVSTTPHLKRAEHYAEHNRKIARIAVDRLEACGVQTFRVSKHVHASLITKPADDEVILVCPGAEYFPKDIIVEVFDLADLRAD